MAIAVQMTGSSVTKNLFILPNVKGVARRMKAARAKRKKDVACRCHYRLVRLLHCSFSALIGNQRGANVT